MATLPFKTVRETIIIAEIFRLILRVFCFFRFYNCGILLTGFPPMRLPQSCIHHNIAKDFEKVRYRPL